MGYEEVKAIANLFLALLALRVLTAEDKFCAGGGIGVGVEVLSRGWAVSYTHLTLPTMAVV